MKALLRSTPAHVAIAVLAMGGWALFANSVHGLMAALGPAAAQGMLSGLITLCLKRALEAMSHWFSGAMALTAPPALTAGTILALLFTIHRLIGTPEIVRTIAVPWMISTIYAIVYAALLVRARQPTAPA